jgi:hypothetical protein
MSEGESKNELANVLKVDELKLSVKVAQEESKATSRREALFATLSSPIGLAIVSGSVTIMAGILTGFVSSCNSLNLEKSKLQGQIIMEAINVPPGPDQQTQVIKNLLFFSDESKIIELPPSVIRSLRSKLPKDEQGPVIPTVARQAPIGTEGSASTSSGKTKGGPDQPFERLSNQEVIQLLSRRPFGTGSFKPKFVVLHHTTAPSLAQRPMGFADVHLINLQNYHKFQLKWKAGPHFLIDQSGIIRFSPLDAPGVHARSFNRDSIGVEMLGNYDVEEWTDPIKGYTIHLLACLCLAIGAEADSIKFHRDDPSTPKTCPGRKIRKSEVVRLVAEKMRDGTLKAAFQKPATPAGP